MPILNRSKVLTAMTDSRGDRLFYAACPTAHRTEPSLHAATADPVPARRLPPLRPGAGGAGGRRARRSSTAYSSMGTKRSRRATAARMPVLRDEARGVELDWPFDAGWHCGAGCGCRSDVAVATDCGRRMPRVATRRRSHRPVYFAGCSTTLVLIAIAFGQQFGVRPVAFAADAEVEALDRRLAGSTGFAPGVQVKVRVTGLLTPRSDRVPSAA